jgi:hypothetical protein
LPVYIYSIEPNGLLSLFPARIAKCKTNLFETILKHFCDHFEIAWRTFLRPMFGRNVRQIFNGISLPERPLNFHENGTFLAEF